MKAIVVNITRALNKIDEESRSKNLIFTAVPEEDVTIIDTDSDENENRVTLSSDEDKIAWLLKSIGNESFVDDHLDNCQIIRFGKEKVGFKRTLKLVVPSIADRDKILKNSNKLKNAPDILNKVYIKKDQHPVYVAENNRLRKKMYDLKKLPENLNKNNVRIDKGKLYVDNVIVDENTFFH